MMIQLSRSALSVLSAAKFFSISANFSTSALVFSIDRRLSRYAVQVGVCVSALVVSSSSTWAIIAIKSLTMRVCSIKSQ